MKDNEIVKISNLKKYFHIGGGNLKAVDGLDFFVYEGETFGLVGESDCGKSTAGRTIPRLYEPTDGEVKFDGVNIYNLKGRDLHEVRKGMQTIFQDPYASLNPRMTVEDIIGEPLDIHEILKGRERYQRIIGLLELVGLSEEHAQRFPHEFSGGQRQRIGIARALALKPKLIICDEPISALGISIQAQIVNLLKDLQKELGLILLFIAYDLSVVRYISDRVGAMYLGQMAEPASSEDLYGSLLHPYIKALLSAIPVADPGLQGTQERIKLDGDVPSLINLKPGCHFVDRCPYSDDQCRGKDPVVEEVKENHYVACFKVREINRS